MDILVLQHFINFSYYTLRKKVQSYHCLTVKVKFKSSLLKVTKWCRYCTLSSNMYFQGINMHLLRGKLVTNLQKCTTSVTFLCNQQCCNQQCFIICLYLPHYLTIKEQTLYCRYHYIAFPWWKWKLPYKVQAGLCCFGAAGGSTWPFWQRLADQESLSIYQVKMPGSDPVSSAFKTAGSLHIHILYAKMYPFIYLKSRETHLSLRIVLMRQFPMNELLI